MEEQQEKIEYQYIMNYKAYRRKMVAIRSAATVVVAGGMCGFCAVSVALGIILAIMALIIGSITVLVSFGNEQTYTVYNTRIVIKKRSSEKRVSVPIENVKAVKYRRAIYEKDLLTGTVIVTAVDVKGKKKKYKMLHIFDAMPMVNYLNDRIKTGGQTNEDRE